MTNAEGMTKFKAQSGNCLLPDTTVVAFGGESSGSNQANRI
jgi:hypothetical protein